MPTALLLPPLQLKEHYTIIENRRVSNQILGIRE